MRKLLYVIGLFSFLLSLPIACSDDILHKEPIGFAAAEGFFQTENDIMVGINGIYPIFQGDIWGGSFVQLQPHFDSATDNAVLCCDWEHGFTAIARGTMSPTSGGIVGWKYNFGYQGLARIHNIMEAIESGTIEDLTPERAALWMGELRFLRGFIYSEMAAVYGGVPLVTSMISNQEAEALTRSTKEEVINLVLQDLDFAADNLEYTPTNGQNGRPTKQAALALKGKVLLYNDRWAEAAATLKELIDEEGAHFYLDNDYEGLFRGTNEESPEIFFSIQHMTDAGGEGSFLQTHYAPSNVVIGGGWGSFTYTRNLLDAYYMTDGLPISDSPLYDPENEIENRDPRLRWTFFFPGDEYRGVILENPTNFLVNGSAVTSPDGVVMRSRKWVSETGNTGESNSPVNLVLMRYSDVLLMYAEAQNEVSGPVATVYEAVNKIRARAGMPDFRQGMSQEEMRQEIRHERRIEFAMEGTRYFDLLRWRTAEEVIPSLPTLENRQFDPSRNYLWPIPQSAMDGFSNIEQNPGY
ncbi:RagB/SusD family nutrient uptake outer membrane protein [Pleomorphovibrio marinus]|uniref:RagB/SusD family nutrient uptake outer membrane protein n=1 Tax=Pleomorphovibrio marinus TaxID=2164132 RepID=UPI000E0B054A|nr:RagB/SusD family nutrient uptake outer membrane protein [Pleomorphovibrio marinus]